MPNTFRDYAIKLLHLLADNAGVFITAAAGAFFGAVSAYWSDRFKERKKRHVEEHGAIVRAQLALQSQLNTVNNIQKQFLEAFRDDPNRSLHLISFTMTDTPLRVAYDAISFLLTKYDPQLVTEVLAAEQSYVSAMDALSARNQAIEKLHENSELSALDPGTGRAFIRPKDARDVKLLKDRTDGLYTATDRAYDRLGLQIKELYKAGKRIYPKSKFILIAGEKPPS
jgi:hypothetical protein